MELAGIDASRLIEALGLALLHFIWQGALIGLLFRVALAALRDAGAPARYWTGVVTLVLLTAAVPLTTAFLVQQPATAASTAATTIAVTASGALNGAGVETGGFSEFSNWIVAAWLLGVALIATRTALSWRGLRRLRDCAGANEDLGLAPLVGRLCALLRLPVEVGIGITDAVAGPMVIGWLKPVILLPPSIVARLPQEQIEMIIAHELAHLRRRDHWVNLFQIVVETLLFYHPVVSWVSRRIRVERENACDDLAIAVTGRRLTYVEMLASLEQSRTPAPALSLGVDDGQIVERIRRLVNYGEPRATRGAAIPMLIAAAAITGLAGAPVVGNLIESDSVQGASPAATDRLEPGPSDPRGQSVPATNRADENRSRLAQPATADLAVDPAGEPTPAETAALTADETGNRAQPRRMAPIDRRRADREAPEPEAPEPAPTSSDNQTVTPQRPAPASARGPDPASRPEPNAGQPAQAPVADRPDSRTPDVTPAESTTPVTPAAVEDAPAAADSPSAGESAAGPALPTVAEPGPALARRSEPIANPADPASAEPSSPEPARPIDGDARRAAELALSGGDLIRQVQPDYPRGALRREVAGLVRLELIIDKNGRVAGTRVQHEEPAGQGFAESVRTAARKWRFEPFRRGTAPVEHRLSIEFEFDPGEGCLKTTGSRIPRC